MTAPSSRAPQTPRPPQDIIGAAPPRRAAIAALLLQLALPIVLGAVGVIWTTTMTPLQAQQALPATTDASVPADVAARLDEGIAAADALRAGNSLPEARARYGLVIADARQAGARRHLAAALWGRGRLQGVESDRAGAKASHQEALEIYRALEDREGEALASRYLGLNLYHLGEFEAARTALRRAAALYEAQGNLHGLAVAYNNMIYLLDAGPERDRARLLALRYADEAGDRSAACGVIHAWGDERFDEGDFVGARPKLLEALDCYQAIDERSDTGRVLVSLGRVERAHGQFASALDYYRRALALQQGAAADARRPDPTGTIQSLNAIAVTYQRMGRFDDARGYFERALADAQALKSETTITFLAGQLGGLHLSLGEYEKAVTLLEASMQYNQKPSHLAIRYRQIAEAWLGLGDVAKAERFAERAVSAARLSERDALVHALCQRSDVARARRDFAAAEQDLREAIAIIEDLRAKTIPIDFMKRGFGDLTQSVFASQIELQSQQERWQLALETAEQARARAFLDLLASRPAGPAAHATPGTLAAAASTPRERGVQAGGSARTPEAAPRGDGDGRARGAAVGDGASRDGAARGDAREEMARDSAVRDSAARDGATRDGATHDGAARDGAAGGTKTADGAAGETAAWDALQPRGGEAAGGAGAGAGAGAVPERSKPVPAPAPPPDVGFAIGLGRSAAEVRSDARLPRLRLDSPRSVPAADIAAMIATAKRLQSTLLAYWVGRTGTFAWVVSPGGRVHATRLDVSEAALEGLVAQMDQSLNGGAFTIVGASQTRPWRELYRLLVRPVRAHLPARPNSLLTIVPHGPLFRVSFAALQDEQGRYLVERYRLHYTPAIGVLQFTAPRPRVRTAAAERALLVGDPGSLTLEPGGDTLAALPWARREVAEIAEQLPKGTPQVLIGDDASEDTVRSKLEGADLLHFATHGVIQQERSLSSYLALRPSPAPTTTSSTISPDASASAEATPAPRRDDTPIMASASMTSASRGPGGEQTPRQAGATGAGGTGPAGVASATTGVASGTAPAGGRGSDDAGPAATVDKTANASASASAEADASPTTIATVASVATVATVASVASAANAANAASDGRLTAEEVYALSLRARLVVLSACRTALGPMTGDGVIGFTRAFLYAGASSVIATEWDVPDEAGYELMRRFYRARAGHALTGRGESDALRTAQLGMIDALRRGQVKVATPTGEVAVPEHPLFWAGFVLVGEP